MLPDELFSSETALVDGTSGKTWTYAALKQESGELASTLPERGLAFCYAKNDAATVLFYLACLRRRLPLALLDASADPQLKARLVERYAPTLVFESGKPLIVSDAAPAPTHADLALLLSTSGTTGSPRMVRLSRKNLEANADSISEYLGLGPGERAVTSLPLHYSYGLSVLNSHLRAGACVVLTGASLIRPEFWDVVLRRRCTSIAAVPYMFQMLTRSGFETMSLPGLRTLTQAGGRLDEKLARRFATVLKNRGGRLFMMYGQTEATARMAYVPPDRLPEKAASAGIAIPGGSFAIVDEQDQALQRGDPGEILYRGPNVMMGYADGPQDLALGDSLKGVLRTGDLGYQDPEGFLHVTGRRSRFSKVFGLRISLDDVEKHVRTDAAPAAAVAGDEKIVVFFEKEEADALEPLRKKLAGLYGLHVSAFEFHSIPALPLKASGKIDYERLKQ